MDLKTVCASLAVATLFCMGNIQVVYGEKMNQVNSSYSLNTQKQKEMKTPPIVQVTGKLISNYKAQINVLNKVHIIDLSANKKEYEKEKLYLNGKVNKSVSLEIGEYLQLMPIVTMNGKGIRGVQKVMEPIGHQSIGEVISVWFYRDDKWELHDIEFKSKGKKSYHYYEIE